MVYMEKVQLLDQGTYTCECRNAAGSSRKEHHLEVHGEHGGTETCGDGWRCCDTSGQGPTGPKSHSLVPWIFWKGCCYLGQLCPCAWLREWLHIPSTLCPSAHSTAKGPGQQQHPEEGFCHRGRRDSSGVPGHGDTATMGDVGEGRAARGWRGRAPADGAGEAAAHPQGRAGPCRTLHLPGLQCRGAGAEGV